MDRSNLVRLLEAAPKLKLGVIGDFCVDVYWEISPELGEKSIETGLVTIPVTHARYSLGGAGNIVANLRGIGATSIDCFGASGTDPFGIWLDGALAPTLPERSRGLVKSLQDGYHTPVYCKPLLDGVEQPRIDLGSTPISDGEAAEVILRLESALPHLDALIVNQQIGFGIHTGHLRRKFAELVRQWEKRLPIVFDGREFLDAYRGVTLKINAAAASRLAFGTEGRPPRESGGEILRRFGRELVVTDGENGCFVFEKERITHVPAIRYDGAIDTVGAGDSFSAGFACALAAGSPMPEAAECGSLCSSITIRRINETGAPTPEELLAIGG